MDNIFIEHLWRSLKYEAMYLNELTDGFKAKQVIDDWFNFYTNQRPHSTFGGRTPAEVYDGAQPMDMMDKPSGLPTYPKALQSQESVINNVLVV